MRVSGTTVLRKFWYPVMPAANLAAGPRQLSLFGEDIVLWCGNDGAVSALRDVCSHQSVRLSLGSVRGTRLVCPQHHWEFAPDGHCVRIPQRHELLPPPATRVRSYRVAKRFGLVWVAVDEPLAPLPDIAEFKRPGYRVVPTLHERWKVSFLTLAEDWLAGGGPPVEIGPFHMTWGSGATGEPPWTATWWVPNCFGLSTTHPNGLQETVVIAATPLSDRWTTVTRLRLRNNSERDLPAAEVIAADRALAASERRRLEELPFVPDDHPRPNPAGQAVRETLRRIAKTSE